MKRVLQTGAVCVALLLGLVPAGSCLGLLVNPHGTCCNVQHVQSAPKSCCNKPGGCSHSKQQNPAPAHDPCCFFAPSDLALVEAYAQFVFVCDLPPAMPFQPARELNSECSTETVSHAPPLHCPSYLLHRTLLV